MIKPISPLEYKPYEPPRSSSKNIFKIEKFTYDKKNGLIELIRENLKEFNIRKKTLLTTYRRLKNFSSHYSQKGNSLYFVCEPRSQTPIACLGLGSFQGLPITEKIGEIANLVVQKDYRQKGLGRSLLNHGLQEAQKIGYKRLYLETSKYMVSAQKLFIQFGFEPVEELPKKDQQSDDIPCYYLLKDLHLKNF